MMDVFVEINFYLTITWGLFLTALCILVLIKYYKISKERGLYRKNLYEHVMYVSISYIGLVVTGVVRMAGFETVSIFMRYISWGMGIFAMYRMIQYLDNE